MKALEWGAGMGDDLLTRVQLERQEREIQIAKANKRLVDFCEYVDRHYHAELHHRLVADKLEQVALYLGSGGQEGINRLMIFMPPREGKSELVSRKFPAWAMGRLPNLKVIQCSYGADLAYEDSAAVRDLIRDGRYQDIFGAHSPLIEEDMPPVMVDANAAAKSAWRLDGTRGQYVAAGIGGAITGKGANLAIIDDPYKNREEADSEANRKRIERWYRSTFRTRLEEPGAIIIVHTRWHREDLAGSLLADSVRSAYGDRWEVVMLPAVALPDGDYPKNEMEQVKLISSGIYLPVGGDILGRKAGEALNPKRMDSEKLEKTKHDVQDEWLPLYQQLPEEAKGEFFSEGMFDIIPERMVPEGLAWYGYIDPAVGKTERADWNTVLPTAVDEKGNVYYRDMLRTHELEAFLDDLEMVMQSEKERNTHWRFESVAFQSYVLGEFLKRPFFSTHFIDIDESKPEKDKVARARPMRLKGLQHQLFLVEGAWNKDFIAEAVRFPRGKHDDQVDTASGGLQTALENAGDSGNGGIHA
ncbi:MAG: hypothetical protein HPY85_06815 [Anaerolineae bacterium]|nr:hypothetical protein [Anaerolineae bacterium]